MATLDTQLSGLNVPQRSAVTCPGGPMLVVAGAGSGKTRVLTLRVAWLLAQGVEPRHILALTFTNKAAREMTERVEQIVGAGAAREIWMGTFHAIFKRVLRLEGEAVGLPPDFTIADRGESETLVARAVKERGLDADRYDKRGVMAAISAAKNDMLTPADYAANEALARRDQARQQPRMPELYQAYNDELRRQHAVDFDDLLMLTERLFREHPDVGDRWAERFRHILVDEYQDTNRCQCAVVNRLARRWRNLFVVGDDAQSIYSFRGARIENILRFSSDYPDCSVFKLEQNYRSTRNIVSAAGSLIAHNVDQIPKTVFSSGAEGPPVALVECASEADEVEWLVRQVGRVLSAGVPPREVAVLYRANAQGPVVERALRMGGVACRVFGQSFFDRAEVRDLTAWLRCIVNPADEASLRRAINAPRRGIGETTLAKLAAQGATLYEALADPERRKRAALGRTEKRVEEFADLLNGLITSALTLDAEQLVMLLLQRSGYLRDAPAKDDEKQERVEIINEFVRYAHDHVTQCEERGERPDAASFLDNISLMSSADEASATQAPAEAVSLMTIHMSKGLEWDYVYVRGVVDESLPSQHSAANPASLQEERRLLYVAMTRARKGLALSWSRERFLYGKMEWTSESRFIGELDPRFCQRYGGLAARTPQRAPRSDVRRAAPYGERRAPLPTQPPAAPPATQRPDEDLPNREVTDDGRFRLGDHVTHERFGLGTVLNIAGRGPDTRLDIDFGPRGKKTLLLKFARIEPSD